MSEVPLYKCVGACEAKIIMMPGWVLNPPRQWVLNALFAVVQGYLAHKKTPFPRPLQ